MFKKLKSFLILLFVTFTAFTQENTYDDQGRRHGLWKEYFDGEKQQPKFEGEFIHGKETGVFKFYQEGLKQPAAIMEFDPASDTVQAKYLTQKGNPISEGQMVDQKRTGLWTYYHKDSDKVLMTENYRDGKLHGLKKIFYENGNIAEEAYYTQGELDGDRKLYSEKGVVLEDLKYRNGELHGPAQFFNGKGELMSEGSYRFNKHHGTWRYYNNGQLEREKEF